MVLCHVLRLTVEDIIGKRLFNLFFKQTAPLPKPEGCVVKRDTVHSSKHFLL